MDAGRKCKDRCGFMIKHQSVLILLDVVVPPRTPFVVVNDVLLYL